MGAVADTLVQRMRGSGGSIPQPSTTDAFSHADCGQTPGSGTQPRFRNVHDKLSPIVDVSIRTQSTEQKLGSIRKKSGMRAPDFPNSGENGRRTVPRMRIDGACGPTSPRKHRQRHGLLGLRRKESNMTSPASVAVLCLLAILGVPLLVAMALLGPRQLTRQAMETLTVVWTVVKVGLLSAASLVLL